MRILLDAMGGDNAPEATIKGAVKASSRVSAEILLIGNQDVINQKVKELYGKESIEEMGSNLKIHHTTETIEMEYGKDMKIKLIENVDSLPKKEEKDNNSISNMTNELGIPINVVE